MHNISHILHLLSGVLNIQQERGSTMKMRLINRLLLAATLVIPTISLAESNVQTGAGQLTATSKLDFSISIPKTLYIRVGTGTALANNSTVDLINFAIPASNVGGGGFVSATASSGDLNSGQVTARVIGNNGAITLGSITTGPLSNGLGDTISYSKIIPSALPNTSASLLISPPLADGTTTNITLTPNIGSKVTNLDAKWTFLYLNDTVPPPGTYGGVNTNSGRVTYTASMP